MQVPLLRLDFGAEEKQAVAEVLASGALVQGERVARFEAAIAARVGRKHAVAVANGTAALELAVNAAGVRAGDEVLVPDMTWPSPGHAVLLAGAVPVLVDIDAAEWNSGAEAFAAARTPHTKAAVVIDQFGAPARVEEIAKALPGVVIIEDAACAIGSTLGNRACGSFGLISCLSFHPRKVVTTGEGGMCLTDDDALADRLRTLRNHGQRSVGDFACAGPNERMQEMAAALGLVQMGHLDEMIAARRAQAAKYAKGLPMLTWQRLAPGAASNHQTMGALLPESFTPAKRDAFVAGLRERGVGAGILSYALHRLPAFKSAAIRAEQEGRTFKHSAAAVDRGVALPCFPTMTDVEQAHVIQTVTHLLRET